jgi:hypothetical protein
LLSKAGKEILIKAIAQAIPTYVMSCFDLKKHCVMTLEQWWGGSGGHNKKRKIKCIGCHGN